MKCCSKCGVEKPLAEFNKDRAKKDGYKTYCKVCHYAATKTWNMEHRERVREAHADWKKRNPEKVMASRLKNAARARERAAAWYKANKERALQSSRIYAQKNKERIATRYKVWRQENKEALKIKWRAWYDKNRTLVAAKHKAIAPILRQYNRDWYRAHIEHKRAKDKVRRESKRDVLRAQARAWAQRNNERVKELRKRRLKEHAEDYRMYAQKRMAKKKVGGGELSPDIIQRLLKLQRGKCACCGVALGKKYHLDHRVPLAAGGAHADSNMQLLRATCNLQKGARDPIVFMQSRGFLL